MYSPFQLAKKYIRYFLSASNGKGHGVHSPFVFDFIIQVLNDRRSFYCFRQIEAIRARLKDDPTILEVEDFGAGSGFSKTRMRSVKEIAGSALKPARFGQLLFRIVENYKPATILELGTSLGITTAYLASANTNSSITTLEGATAIAGIASLNFKTLQLDHISLVPGNFDETLPPVLKQMPSPDLVFIDGNHREEPTLRYFNLLLQHSNDHTILVFDDIHWSKEMERAWAAIQSHEKVTLTIDLFFIGLVFFRKEFRQPQHFTIRF